MGMGRVVEPEVQMKIKKNKKEMREMIG